MNNPSKLVSKVLVLDDAGTHFDLLKAFYDESGLVGIRPPHQAAAERDVDP